MSIPPLKTQDKVRKSGSRPQGLKLDKWSALRWGNLLYKHAFPLYRPLYFLYKSISDRDKISLLRTHIRPGMKVLDIGANIGFYTLLLSNLVGPPGRVYSFEPDPLNFRRLKTNSRRSGNVVLNQMACGEKTGKIRLYHSEELNVDHQTYDGGENRTSLEIDCVSLDSYLKNNEEIDFIKIDIQGYEYFAFRGMRETIRRSNNVMVLGELWPYGLQKAGIDFRDFLVLLKDLGFELTFFDKREETDYQDKVSDKFFHTDFWGVKGSQGL
jgi:FkbM family methyltransferase